MTDTFSFNARVNSGNNSIDKTDIQSNNKLIRTNSKFSFNIATPRHTAHDMILEEIESKTKARGLIVTQSNLVIIPEQMSVDLFNSINVQNKNYLTKDEIIY